MGITHCAKETAELDIKKEVWSYSKGCWPWKKGSEQRVLPALLAEAAGAGDLGETLICGVRGVTGSVLKGTHCKDFRWIKWVSVICTSSGSAVYCQHWDSGSRGTPFLQASVHPELPPVLGLSSGVAVVRSPNPAWAALAEANYHWWITSAQTWQSQGESWAQEWHTPCKQVGGSPRMGTARSVERHSHFFAFLPHQVLMSSGPAALYHVHRSVDVLCASILFPFLPISIRFDCGQSLVDRREGRGGLIQSFYLALCLIKTTTNGTV